MNHLIPTSLNQENYPVICVIKNGELFAVHLVANIKEQKLRIIKLSKSELQGKYLENFMREVHILHTHQHPTIMKIFQYGDDETDNVHFPWMELDYLPCGSISDYINSLKLGGYSEIDPTKCLIMIYGTAYAINLIHSHDVIHRDIKPANVMLDQNLEPILGDFGFAKVLKPGSDISCYPYTVNYAAPELLTAMMKNDNYSSKVDVFSFGLFLYELRTLNVPFEEMRVPEIVNCITSNEIVSIDPDDPYYEVFCHATVFDPDLRPSMKSILTELDNLACSIPDIDLVAFNNYKEKIVNYKPGDPIDVKGTLENLSKVVEKELPLPQYILGLCHYYGILVPQDMEKAIDLIRKSSDQRYLPAMMTYETLLPPDSVEYEELIEKISNITEPNSEDPTDSYKTNLNQ